MLMAFTQHMQHGIIAVAMFVGLWGVINFSPCLWRVLHGKFSDPEIGHYHCHYHAGSALVGLGMIAFCIARVEVVADFLGHIWGSWVWMAGMICFVFKIGINSWSLNKEKAASPRQNTQSLAWVFSMEIIMILAFVVVGFLGSMK